MGFSALCSSVWPLPRAVLLALVAVGTLSAASADILQPDQSVPATGTIEYAFTPGTDAAGLIIRTIGRARTAIYVQAFSFTHKGIAQALIDAAARGVQVQVIADQGQRELIDHNVLPMIAASRARVFIDGQHSAAHDKMILVDPESANASVVTGSFNFTFAAQYRNAENVLNLRGNRELARIFLRNWHVHRSHATAFDERTPHKSGAGNKQ